MLLTLFGCSVVSFTSGLTPTCIVWYMQTSFTGLD